MKFDNWCQNLFKFKHFPDQNPNSYDNLNNMKLDLNVSAKVKFKANDQGFKFKY